MCLFLIVSHFNSSLAGAQMGADGLRTDWAPLAGAAGDAVRAQRLGTAAGGLTRGCLKAAEENRRLAEFDVVRNCQPQFDGKNIEQCLSCCTEISNGATVDV